MSWKTDIEQVSIEREQKELAEMPEEGMQQLPQIYEKCGLHKKPHCR